MTVTELGNMSVLKLGEPIFKDTDASLFKATLDGVLLNGDASENVSAAEYEPLCAFSDEAAEEAEEVADEEETTITSCLDCDAKFECEHFINGGNDILADNGWTVTVSKKNGGTHKLNKNDLIPELDLPMPDFAIDFDLSNIHLPVELLKKRRAEAAGYEK